MAVTVNNILASVLERTGVALPSAILILAILALLYPDRVIGTAAPRPGIPRMPGALPLIGNTWVLIKNGTEEQFHRLQDFTKDNKIGVLQTSVLGLGRQFIVVRPEYIEAVQKTYFDHFVKGRMFRARFEDVLGVHGIFVADGENWKGQRKRASHIFSAGQFRNWVQTTVHGELKQVFSLLQEVASRKSSGSNKILLPELFFRYTLSSFSKMAFSADLKCLSSSPDVLETPVPFATAFDFAQCVINERFVYPGFQIYELFSSNGRKMRQAIQQLRKTGLEIISDRIERRQQEQKHGADAPKEKRAIEKDGKDMLDLFMDITTDPEDLLVVVMNFLIAGRDTTAQSLSWLFFELFQHPEHVKELITEIESVYGAQMADKPHLMGYDDMKKLPFTQACFSEAVRLHPAVPKNGKICCKDVLLKPAGPNPDNLPAFEVKKGEWCGWSDWVMNRRTDVWGEDAAEYNPYRFISVNETTGTRTFISHNQWKFHSFNGGPRLCLGQ
ncbi:cytochrome P450 [Tilletiaria anomala UBC 951]|uniref:Cytochrome P450 n=1 Tax=Tilletiaria anomala (strain ATCC 24038 / CBS 436.72 / UBC 951) TaxID=1037660 RepID=A0A066WEY5_TILAU|nr:cytochrome P450 [Tilletiaria anomala UBC 951]KDN52517.1 cytochrome P450 [Tilletiaria anomala UBC 951]